MEKISKFSTLFIVLSAAGHIFQPKRKELHKTMQLRKIFLLVGIIHLDLIGFNNVGQFGHGLRGQLYILGNGLI